MDEVSVTILVRLFAEELIGGIIVGKGNSDRKFKLELNRLKSHVRSGGVDMDGEMLTDLVIDAVCSNPRVLFVDVENCDNGGKYDKVELTRGVSKEVLDGGVLKSGFGVGVFSGEGIIGAIGFVRAED